jgi:PIN domain nuclease of toxin-antitoxin system
MVGRLDQAGSQENEENRRVIYLDTHVTAAVCQAKLGSLSKEARRLLNRETQFRISPMVLLELEYLREIGRIRLGARELLSRLGPPIGLLVCDLPFQNVALQAASESWTRDPFDRIIVAQARLAKAVLITRDGNMLAHYNKAVG